MHCCVQMYIVRNMSAILIFFYPCIINCIQSAEKECIPFESIGKSFHIVPIGTNYVKDWHAVTRDAFWLWNLYGRLNQGHLYHSMGSTRAQFKYALKYAKRIEETAKADALAKDLQGQKIDKFWKSVNRINNQVNYILLLLMALLVKPILQSTGEHIFMAY